MKLYSWASILVLAMVCIVCVVGCGVILYTYRVSQPPLWAFDTLVWLAVSAWTFVTMCPVATDSRAGDYVRKSAVIIPFRPRPH